jgi:endonuclease/exonuclease/phosphatase family metal-dependent hydrolase
MRVRVKGGTFRAMESAQSHVWKPADREHQFETIIENRPSSGIAGRLRVVAFNAQGGVRFDGIRRCFEREPLKSASIILLSEADLLTRRSGGRKIAQELAEALGMSYAYVPEFGLMGRDGAIRSYLGNAILAKEPLHHVSTIPLPKLTMLTRQYQPSLRGFRRQGGPAGLVATIEVLGKPIHICVAHLDSRAAPAARDLQVAALLESFPPRGAAIIGGDFNTTTVELVGSDAFGRVVREMLLNSKRFRCPQEYEPLFGRLSKAGFEVRGANAEGIATFTFSRLVPPWLRPRLDWIALRNLQPVEGSAAVIPARPDFFSTRVSDHDFIVADIAV